MRTVKQEFQVCHYDELDDVAKEKARDWYREGADTWSWSSEWWGSAKAFSDIAPITIESADYDRGHCDITWTDDCDVESLEGLRAWKWLENNGWFDWAKLEQPGRCSMTGFCGDAPFADPLVEYYRTSPRHIPDLKQVFYECAQSWVFEARSDMEYSYSDEAVAENIEANDYEFTIEGAFHV